MTRRLLIFILISLGCAWLARILCLYGRQVLAQLDSTQVMAHAFPEDPRYAGFDFQGMPDLSHRHTSWEEMVVNRPPPRQATREDFQRVFGPRPGKRL